VVERVLEATQEAAEGRPDWDWGREERNIRGLCTSWLKKKPPKPEKKHKPIPKHPNIDKPIILAEADEGMLADRRDDPEPAFGNGASGQVLSFAVAKADRDLKKAGKKSTHVVLAKGLLEALKERSEWIVYDSGRLHRHRDKLWGAMRAEQEKTWLAIEAQLGCEALDLVPRNALISEVVNWIRRCADLHHDKIAWDQHGMIATQSGMYDLITSKLRPTQPEDYATHRIECEYDAKAKCPLWLQFLKDCMPNQNTIAVVQEFFGAALLDKKPRDMTRAMVLFAPPSTGKSSLLSVFAGMLCDSPNVTPFDTLENSHGTSAFLRPVPWILHEAFDQSKWHFSATAKALLSGDDKATPT
jgi:D5 N terminal like